MDFEEPYGFMLFGRVEVGGTTLASLRQFYPTAKVVVIDTRMDPQDVPWVDVRTSVVRLPGADGFRAWQWMHATRAFACGALLHMGVHLSAPLPPFSEPCFLAAYRDAPSGLPLSHDAVGILPWVALEPARDAESLASFCAAVLPAVRKLYATA